MIAPVSAAATAAQTNCFVYGTLMAPEVVQALLDKRPCHIPGAVLPQHARYPVAGQKYPAVLPANNTCRSTNEHRDQNSVKGLLLLDLSTADMKMLDYFEDEGVDYIRKRVEVRIPDSSIANLDHTLLARNFPALSKSNSKNGYHCVQTNAYIWARGEDTLDLSKVWDYESFRKQHLQWYLDSTVYPCRNDFIERGI